MTHAVEAVLFDLGDTVINFGIMDAEGLFHKGAELTHAYLAARYPIPDFAEYRKMHYRGIRRAYLWSRICRREFNSMHTLNGLLQKMNIHLTAVELDELTWLWYQPILDIGRMEAGLAEMLEELQESGIKLGIVSNTFISAHCLDRQLKLAGVLHYFPVRIYSSDVRYQKPHKQIFLMALQALGVSPQHTVFVGDLLSNDIKGARRVGMRTVWKPAEYYPHDREKYNTADALIQQLVDLPMALRKWGWKPRLKAAPVALKV